MWSSSHGNRAESSAAGASIGSWIAPSRPNPPPLGRRADGRVGPGSATGWRSGREHSGGNSPLRAPARTPSARPPISLAYRCARRSICGTRKTDSPRSATIWGSTQADVKLVYQTSGTTGRPSRIALTRADAEMWWTIGARSYRATGCTHHSVLVSPSRTGPFVAGHTRDGSVDRTGCPPSARSRRATQPATRCCGSGPVRHDRRHTELCVTSRGSLAARDASTCRASASATS